MAKLVLKQEILEKVKTDPVLFGEVMEELDTTPSYGLQLLKNNSIKLTQAGVLQIIKDYLKVPQDMDLLEEMQEVEQKNTAA